MENENKMQNELTIGFIGAGNMAEAMISALIRKEVFPPGNIVVSDMVPERGEFIKKTYNVSFLNDNIDVVEKSDIVVLAVKPQQMTRMLKDLVDLGAFDLKQRRLLAISIAAGVKLETLENSLYAGKTGKEKQFFPIIRVMPNTPALVGAGMCAFSANSHANSFDIENTRRVLGAMGDVLNCDETKMDAVTAISGSGPAYCFYFIEAVLEAGEQLGLTTAEAYQLTLSTFRGSLRLMETQKEPPASLRRKVTSPGGTTEAAISVFDDSQLKQIINSAILAAADRSRQLGRLSSSAGSDGK